MDLIKKHAEKLKFAIVGGANTALDFLILFVLVGFGMNAIGANYISTGIAFIFSFFVNKSFTFNNKSKKVLKQFALFIAVTIFGLWVIQPIIIAGFIATTTSFAWEASAVLFIAKIIATLASLVWNYLWYSKVVFKKA
jgi:putative flippase GtrA